MLCSLAFGQGTAPPPVELPSIELESAEQQTAEQALVEEDSAEGQDRELDGEGSEKEQYEELAEENYEGETGYAELAEEDYGGEAGEEQELVAEESDEEQNEEFASESADDEELESGIPELATAPTLYPALSAEKTLWRNMAKNYIVIDPIFITINTALGVVLGLNGIKEAFNENLEQQVQDVYVLSELILRARGKATITNIKSSGFGFALQYERQLLENYSVMGRFSYSGLGLSLDFKDEFEDIDRSRDGVILKGVERFLFDINYFNWSFELHNRYYPRAGGSLFVDGVIGFGGVGLSVKKTHIDAGDYVIRKPDGSFAVESLEKRFEVLNVPARRGYMLIGPMFGWREVFGKEKGGFIWETSIGYLAGIGKKSLADQTVAGNIALPDLLGETAQDISDGMSGVLGLVESLVVVGGPRLRMTIGWAF